MVNKQGTWLVKRELCIGGRARRRDEIVNIEDLDVALLRCARYGRREIKSRVAQICAALGFTVKSGAVVLLKPNLVSGLRNAELACTHAEFAAAIAEWFVDQGARVRLGDSPAFGSATGVMAACGMREAMRGLPVELVDFDSPRPIRLASGYTVGIDAAALECDLLVNLPKVKAHGQLLVSLAVKNYFGAVVGFRKPWLHARFGEQDNRFEALLADLLAVLPGGISLADGVTAMHVEGPVKGRPYGLNLMAGSLNPVALDTALLVVLGVEPERSALWRECARRDLAGSRSADLAFPLLAPQVLAVDDFVVPATLTPVSFHPWRLFTGSLKRLRARIFAGD